MNRENALIMSYTVQPQAQSGNLMFIGSLQDDRDHVFPGVQLFVHPFSPGQAVGFGRHDGMAVDEYVAFADGLNMQFARLRSIGNFERLAQITLRMERRAGILGRLIGTRNILRFAQPDHVAGSRATGQWQHADGRHASA